MTTGGEPASPTDERGLGDPGDQTQRNFRYQHAYGVVLLAASARKELPYTSLWCEQHEDYLAERTDGRFDAYQVKTATPEDGAWVWTKEALRNSIKRFVWLDALFPGRIAGFYFVSNVQVLDSQAEKEAGRSPPRLLEALGGALSERLQAAFDALQSHCECDESSLRKVLHRLTFKQGPARDSIIAELAQSHLPALDACRSMTASQLARCLDGLLLLIYRASSLAVDDPSRHYCRVDGSDLGDPYLRAKCISVASFLGVLRELDSSRFSYSMATRLVPSEGPRAFSVLEQKLIRGGLAEYIDLFRDRAVSAERHLLELAHRHPEQIDGILKQLDGVVSCECDEAKLVASQAAESYGPQMLSEVLQRLRNVAATDGEFVHRQGYDLLAGVAALLTEECRVWWSKQFDLEATE